MSKLRMLIVGAGAALAIGGGSALANGSALSPTSTERDSHGDAVSLAAQKTCPEGPKGVHGECVSDIASSKAESETKDADADQTKDPDKDKDHGKTTKDVDKDRDHRGHGPKL